MYTKVTADEVAKKYADQYNAAKKGSRHTEKQ